MFGIIAIFIFRALVLSTRKNEQQKEYKKQIEEYNKQIEEDDKLIEKQQKEYDKRILEYNIQAKRIVRCKNCGNKMTYGYFRKYGCQKCHTDLFDETGEYAE